MGSCEFYFPRVAAHLLIHLRSPSILQIVAALARGLGMRCGLA